MKVIKNTLTKIMDRWDDPGEYPSGAGGGPLPSHDYVAEVAGEVEVEMTLAEENLVFVNQVFISEIFHKALDKFLESQEIELPPGIHRVGWNAKMKGHRTVVLTVRSFEETNY